MKIISVISHGKIQEVGKMKNGKIAAMISTLKRKGIEIDTETALEVLIAMATRKEVEYEVGDFVEVYEGMGECAFGEIRQITKVGYKVEMWDESTEEFTYTRSVQNDISCISSKEEAREYYLVRSGQKK